MRATRGDASASTVDRRGPARIGARAPILLLMAIALSGCSAHSATGSTGSAVTEGGVGPSSPGDGGAPLLPVGAASPGGVVSPAPTGSASATATVTPSSAGDRGTTGDAAAAVDSSQAHEICSQSWSGQVNAQPFWTPAVGTRMLALDGVGNVYVAANFYGTVNVAGQIFDTSAGTSLLVVKLDPSCQVIWVRAFGAPQAGFGLASIAADAAGDVVVVGSLGGAPVDFGSGPVAPPGLSGGSSSGVIFKLDPDGNGLWSHSYQASALSGADIYMGDVAIDSRGNTVFLASIGTRALVKPIPSATLPASVDFGGGAVAFSVSLVGLDDNGQFVFNVDPSSAGVAAPFVPHSVTTDSAGRIWVAGYEQRFFDQVDIVAFDAGGHQQWVQSVSVAGYGDQWDPMVRIDANDEAFTAEDWVQTLADGGGSDEALLYKLSASGSPSWTPPAAIPHGAWGPLRRGADSPVWAGGRLGVDPSGRAVVSGDLVGSADLGSVGTLTSAGQVDSVVYRFDAQGRLIGGGRWGGAENDVPVDVVVDAAGDAVIAGWSMPPTAVVGVDGGSSPVDYAIFVAKLGW